MITTLKGSPIWSIDSQGIITITTTWMCINDEDTIKGWLGFVSAVEAFAGKPGDPYKMPTASSESEDATVSTESTETDDEYKDGNVYAYKDTNTFIVQDVKYEAAPGRTHYEVEFTNIQNFSTMTLIGGVEASINENNERTKTAKYRVSLIQNQTDASDGESTVAQPITTDGEGTDTPPDMTPLDAIMIPSGTVASWAGEPYMIESSEYNVVSYGIYEITIQAKDMSHMMIGLPDIQTDNLGNQTVTVVWRYALTAFDENELPVQGSDATGFIGGREGFVVQEVDVQHVGVLGYNVTIKAVKHRVGVLISASRKDNRRQDGEYYTEWESKFQTDAPNTALIGAENLADIEVDDLLPSGYQLEGGTVREVSFDEYVTGKYNVTVVSSNEPEGTLKWGKAQNDDDDSWSIQVTQAYFRLTAEQAGWAKAPSGEYYNINFPPATTFTYPTSPDQLISLHTDTGANTIEVTQDKILQLVKSGGKIGFDSVVGVQGFNKKNKLVWLSDTERKAITDLSSVQTILMEGYVHAQPPMQEGTKTLRNQVFRPWDPRESCPVYNPQWDNLTVNGRYRALKRKLIGYKVKYHEIQVTQRYDISLKRAFKTSMSTYFKEALSKIKCSNYVSYKNEGVSFSISDDGITEVTCIIHALPVNHFDFVWNGKYDGELTE